MEVVPFRNPTIAYVYARRHEIDMSPTYQRQGAIWSKDKQQLLIDTLLNGFDVPKIYFHQFGSVRTLASGQRVRWALIDGKQRLEAIFDFLDGSYALSDDFELIASGDKSPAGLTYPDLKRERPDLINLLDATALDIITVRTDDLELIEEMFSRLNEAVPLNAAEKRNAFGGPCPPAVRRLSEREFFTKKLPFTNSRYRHYDLAAKFLYWEDRSQRSGDMETDARPVAQVPDVKKYRLDTFFREMKGATDAESRVEADELAVESVLDALESLFIDSDPLLGSVGMVHLYYLLAGFANKEAAQLPSREALMEFDRARRAHRVADEDDLRPGQYQLLEFDRLAQSPNDGSALSFRLTALLTYLSALYAGQDPLTELAKIPSSLG